MFRSVDHARWFPHANGVNPPREMRRWLTDRTSLTVKLTAHSSHFRVQRLHQNRGLCLADEYAEIGLPCRAIVREREVLLRCDEQPVVFAHTIVPMTATASDWPFFGTLGDRSLGTTLFGDPLVWRGQLQFARLKGQHPLVRRANAAIGVQSPASPLYARRCLFRRKNGALLVTEIFLPAIAMFHRQAPRNLLTGQPVA
ncbi:MAG: chorismate lyase [Herminiimonas sp.]|nr:chorismate lyase [Herminiimonas sp.]